MACFCGTGIALCILAATGLPAAADQVEELVAVSDPPPVQMLVPGFSVREVPVELNNINNLRYRADRKLYALGYDGDIWLLSDADGDGVPDSKSRFFENKGRLRGPIGMQVIPPRHALLMAESGGRPAAAQGVVVASKGKISAILDMDGDDVAEIERVIATGWKEIPQNVDAIGVAIHPDDGAIYFGLGTAAYNNAYLLDKEGRSAFDLASERGTIQRIEPDLSRRTTVCTGVRFTIGMEFNADKELIVTEQEGATWLPNGNPFDELLHIRPGRHYGFPPRHPKHLPNVFDEPSLFDYGPQHQSTCGMAFNLPLAEGGPIFGPDHWQGDALVCGESRGKLYRTRLVKDATGEYVAANQIIACLSMLTVDCCLTPRGDLLVACHSGGPDWGTGPSGKGKIFLIRYDHHELPLPTAVTAVGPQEVQIHFDRPLDPERLKDLAAQTKITYGQYVAAADRFETIRPGYAVTKAQLTLPRYRLPVYAAGVTPDRRTLILTTGPHRAAVQYAVTLPGLGREASARRPGELAEHPQVDLEYSLASVRATWQPRDANQPAVAATLPHLDFAVAKTLARGQVDVERFLLALEQPGTLTLETQIDTQGLFLPVVQPISQLDYDPRDDGWLTARAIYLRGGQPFVVSVRGLPAELTSVERDGSHEVSIPVPVDQSAPIAVKLSLKTSGQRLALSASWFAEMKSGQVRSGSLALRRLLLPWAESGQESTAPPPERNIPELAETSWGRGRRVFHSEEAACAKCHLPDAAGHRIGPDLANLVHRDYASVLRDITQPSFAINPDHITYAVALRDGRVLSGVVHGDGDQVIVGDKDGNRTVIRRGEIETLQPSPLSVMPEGVVAKLGAQKLNDLLAFLLKQPPHMPRDAKLAPPRPRTRGEVAAVLGDNISGHAGGLPHAKPLNILLVAGKKDHGPGEHDYPAWLGVWSELLEAADGVTVSTAMEWPSAEQISAADVIMFYQKGSWTEERAKAIDAHLAKGGGIVYIHWAVEGGPEAPEFAKRIGLASDSRKIRFRHGPLDLNFQSASDHPIARGFDRVHFVDESYWDLPGAASPMRVLATGIEQDQPRPLFWTLEHARGRVFVSILGHYSWTFDDPLFRTLLLRGIAWSAHEPVDRLSELATLGANLAP